MTLYDKLFDEIVAELNVLHPIIDPGKSRREFMIISTFLRELCQRIDAIEKQMRKDDKTI